MVLTQKCSGTSSGMILKGIDIIYHHLKSGPNHSFQGRCAQLGLALISEVYTSGRSDKVAGSWAKEILVRWVSVSWLTLQGKDGK